MERRKRRAVEPIDSAQSRAKRAAADVLWGKPLRDATREHGASKTHVSYYVAKWRGSEMADVLNFSSPSSGSRATGSSSSQHGGSASADVPLPIACDLPAQYDTWNACRRKKFVLRLAAMLVQQHGYSVRRAAHALNVKFSAHDIVPKVSRTGVQTYVANEKWSPQALGRRTVLPPAFDSALIKWINARRALHFPVFKDDVLAAANLLIREHGMSSETFCREVDRGWYYRFLGRHANLLGTANQRPLEADRARWSTAKNVGDWYQMLAESLVDLGLAEWNADYDRDAAVGTRASELIIITKPDRVISFDETRVELDMTKASKEKRAKIVIDKSADRSTAAETLAFKGGLQGTGVGGSTASGRALPALFVFQGHSLQPRWLSQSPDCDFYDENGRMRECSFLCNKKGGVVHDVGVLYLRDVILPCFPDIAASNPICHCQ